jgi:hypothetical protein
MSGATASFLLPEDEIVTADGRCVLIDPTALKFDCSITDHIDEGQPLQAGDIMVAGTLSLAEGSTSTFAILGGTGPYRTARGDVISNRPAARRFRPRQTPADAAWPQPTSGLRSGDGDDRGAALPAGGTLAPGSAVGKAPARLTVPQGMSERDVAQVLAQQRGWIAAERRRQVPTLERMA